MSRSNRERCDHPGVLPPCNWSGKYKVSYRSEAQALRVARRRTDHVTELRVYQCDGCRGWHLTSQPARRKSA